MARNISQFNMRKCGESANSTHSAEHNSTQRVFGQHFQSSLRPVVENVRQTTVDHQMSIEATRFDQDAMSKAALSRCSVSGIENRVTNGESHACSS